MILYLLLFVSDATKQKNHLNEAKAFTDIQQTNKTGDSKLNTSSYKYYSSDMGSNVSNIPIGRQLRLIGDRCDSNTRLNIRIDKDKCVETTDTDQEKIHDSDLLDLDSNESDHISDKLVKTQSFKNINTKLNSLKTNKNGFNSNKSLATITTTEVFRTINDFSFDSSWTKLADDTGYSQTFMSSLEMNFKGSDFYFLVKSDKYCGKVQLFLDGNFIGEHDSRSTSEVLAEKRLPGMVCIHGWHTAKLVLCSDRQVYVKGMGFTHNVPDQFFGFRPRDYVVYSGSHVWLEITSSFPVTEVTKVTVRFTGITASYPTNFITKTAEATFFTGTESAPLKFESASKWKEETENVTVLCEIVRSSLVDFEKGSFSTMITIMNIDTDPFNPMSTIPFSAGTTVGNWEPTGVGTSGNENLSWTCTFTGTYVAIYGERDFHYVEMEITIDSQLYAIVNTYGDFEPTILLYCCNNLPLDTHTLTITPYSSGKIQISHVQYSTKENGGRLEFSVTKMDVFIGSRFQVKISRLEGLKGDVTAKIKTVNGINTADGTHFNPIDQTITFASGQKELEITVFTLDFDYDIKKTYEFILKLSNPTGAKISINSVLKINIIVYPKNHIKTIEPNQIGVAPDQFVSYSFVGNRVFIYMSNIAPLGSYLIYIDSYFETIEHQTRGKQNPYLIYISKEISYAEYSGTNHSLKIRNLDKITPVSGIIIKVYDNHTNGLFNFLRSEYVVDMNSTCHIEILRNGGADGFASLGIEVVGGNATTGNDISSYQYKFKYNKITFAKNQVKNYFKLFTGNPHYYEPEKRYTLTLRLKSTADNVIIGDNNEVNITIIDPDLRGTYFEQILPSSTNFTTTGTWTMFDAWNGGPLTESSGDSIIVRFFGQKVFVYGTVSMDHGRFDIRIDSSLFINDFNGDAPYNTTTRQLNTLMYESPLLSPEDHVLQIIQSIGCLQVSHINVLNFLPPTEHFSISMAFIPTHKFQQTNEFPKTNQYMKTNHFALTNDFTASSTFEINKVSTNTFTPSNKFTPSDSKYYERERLSRLLRNPSPSKTLQLWNLTDAQAAGISATFLAVFLICGIVLVFFYVRVRNQQLEEKTPDLDYFDDIESNSSDDTESLFSYSYVMTSDDPPEFPLVNFFKSIENENDFDNEKYNNVNIY